MLLRRFHSCPRSLRDTTDSAFYDINKSMVLILLGFKTYASIETGKTRKIQQYTSQTDPQKFKLATFDRFKLDDRVKYQGYDEYGEKKKTKKMGRINEDDDNDIVLRWLKAVQLVDFLSCTSKTRAHHNPGAPYARNKAHICPQLPACLAWIERWSRRFRLCEPVGQKISMLSTSHV